MDRPNKNVARGEATRSQLIAIATRMFAEARLRGHLDRGGAPRGGGQPGLPLPPLREQGGPVRGRGRGGRDQRGDADPRRRGRGGRPGGRAAGRVPQLDPARGDPVVQRILLIDAPSVLGWERWRAMEEDHALGGIKAILQLIAMEGKLRPELADTLAHVLLASVDEVALLVARAQDKEAAMHGADTIDELFRRLFG